MTPGPNSAPVAEADSYTVRQGTTLSRSAPGVLANDTDTDGDTLAATVIEKPAHGVFTSSSDGKFTYTPLDGYSGLDSFTYKATDGEKESKATKVSITVTPSKRCAATVSIRNAAAVTEGNSGTRKLTFPVTASNTAYCGALTVRLKAAGGTATKGTDYTAPRTTAVIPKGKTTGSISVSVSGDKTAEPDETVTLTLTSVSAPSGSPRRGVVKGSGKIRDDDGKP